MAAPAVVTFAADEAQRNAVDDALASAGGAGYLADAADDAARLALLRPADYPA